MALLQKLTDPHRYDHLQKDKPLRHVNIDSYHLKIWDAQKQDHLGKFMLSYEFSKGDGTVLFKGSDFACSPMVSIDSDDCLRCLLGFLTLRPGDTDKEYFDSYTKDQMNFAMSDAESLSIYADEDREEPFVEVE